MKLSQTINSILRILLSASLLCSALLIRSTQVALAADTTPPTVLTASGSIYTNGVRDDQHAVSSVTWNANGVMDDFVLSGTPTAINTIKIYVANNKSNVDLNEAEVRLFDLSNDTMASQTVLTSSIFSQIFSIDAETLTHTDTGDTLANGWPIYEFVLNGFYFDPGAGDYALWVRFPNQTGAAPFWVSAAQTAGGECAHRWGTTITTPGDLCGGGLTPEAKNLAFELMFEGRGITSTAPDGIYQDGDNIPIKIEFSEPVTVTGTPQLQLETGDDDAIATYVSGSGTTLLTFNYAVAATHTSTDLAYDSINALTLNGGTIQDTAGNSATLTLSVPGTNGSLSANKDLVISALPVAHDDSAMTQVGQEIEFSVVANDVDADGQIDFTTVDLNPLTPEEEKVFVVANKGSFTVDNFGSVTFGPLPDFVSTVSIPYTIKDVAGTTSKPGQITVRVNAPPTATDDTGQTNEDTDVLLSVVGNDIDVDDPNTLSIVAVGDIDNGRAVISGTVPYTQILYIPELNFFGTDVFTYTVEDPSGIQSTAAITVTVDPTNDAPQAVADAETVDEDSVETLLAVLENDSIEPDVNETLRVVDVNTPDNGGQVVISGTTHLRYTPAPDFFGTEIFTYTIEDDGGLTAKNQVVITVDAVNDDPIAVNDVYTGVVEDSINNIFDILDNDRFDPDVGETLLVSAVGTPTKGGRVVINNSTQLNYMPDANFYGTEMITYTIVDGNGGSAVGQLTVTVDNVNDDPQGHDDSDTVVEDSGNNLLDVIANDEYAPDDGELLTLHSVGTPSEGGVATFTPNGTEIAYTPKTNFFGTEIISYTLKDNNGGFANATATFTVTNTNDEPTVVDDNFSVTEDITANILQVLSNDSDAPDTGETLRIVAVGMPNQGGTAVISGTTLISYTPSLNVAGTETFTYTVADDGQPINLTATALTATAQVTVSIDNVNDQPQALDDSYVVDEDTGAHNFSVLLNDRDPDVGDTLTVDALGEPSQQGQALIISGTNVISYTPLANFFGTEVFTYTIHDADGVTDTAQISIQVDNVNDDPTASDDVVTVDEDSGTTTIAVLTNDGIASDVDETLSISAISAANIHGTVALSGTTQINYTTAANFFGTETFGYTLSDGNGGSTTAQVTVQVNNVNDLPVALPDDAVVDEDSGGTMIDVLDNDGFAPDVGETLVVRAVTLPDKGGSAAIISGAVGVTSAMQIRYTPKQNFFGTERFTYMVDDGNGGLAETSVTVNVLNVNDDPIANDDVAAVAEDSQRNLFSVLSNDEFAPDANETLIIHDVGQPDQGGTVTMNGTSQLSYTPAPNFFGTETITYTVDDGYSISSAATVVVTVSNVNDNPMTEEDRATFVEDSGSQLLNVLANDGDEPDRGETLIISALGRPDHGGTIYIEGTGGKSDGANLADVMQIHYTPLPNFFGTETFTYTVADEHGGSAQEQVIITMANVNDDPVANGDSFSVPEDTGRLLSVLDNDSAAPDVGETLSIVEVGATNNGGTALLVGTTTISYTPALNFVGTETFTYTLSDGNLGTDMATVMMKVDDMNDLPIAMADLLRVDENSGAHEVDVLANDVDRDVDDRLTIVAVGAPPSGGTATIHNTMERVYTDAVRFAGSTQIRYTPPADFYGTDSFTYTVQDAAGATSTAQIEVEVMPQTYELVINQVGSGVVNSAGGTYIDGEEIALLATAREGWQFESWSGDLINDSAAFTLTIDGNMEITATFIVEPEPSEAPIARNDIALLERNQSESLDVLANDSDPEGDHLIIDEVGQPNHGIAMLVDTHIIYTPTIGFEGRDTFTYTVSDRWGYTDTASISALVVHEMVALPIDTGDPAAVISIREIVTKTTGSGRDFLYPVDINIEVPSRAVFRSTENGDDVTLQFVWLDRADAEERITQEPYKLSDVRFIIQAFVNDKIVEHYTFDEPMRVTLDYDADMLVGQQENSMRVFYWDPIDGSWKDDGITITQHDLVNHRLTIEIDHLTEFAILVQPSPPLSLDQNDGEPTDPIWLPLILR